MTPLLFPRLSSMFLRTVSCARSLRMKFRQLEQQTDIQCSVDCTTGPLYPTTRHYHRHFSLASTKIFADISRDIVSVNCSNFRRSNAFIVRCVPPSMSSSSSTRLGPTRLGPTLGSVRPGSAAPSLH